MSRCTAQSRTHLRDLRYKIRHLCCCKNLLSAIAAALIVAGSRMCLLLPPPPAAQCVQRWARLGFGPLASALGHVAQSEGERDTHNRNRREHPEPTRENVGSKFQMCRIQRYICIKVWVDRLCHFFNHIIWHNLPVMTPYPTYWAGAWPFHSTESLLVFHTSFFWEGLKIAKMLW
jgi:hypothetical protein